MTHSKKELARPVQATFFAELNSPAILPLLLHINANFKAVLKPIVILKLLQCTAYLRHGCCQQQLQDPCVTHCKKELARPLQATFFAELKSPALLPLLLHINANFKAILKPISTLKSLPGTAYLRHLRCQGS